MKENLQSESIDRNGASLSGNGQSEDLPMMSKALSHPAITAIQKEEAVVSYKDALRGLNVPQEDIERNSSQVLKTLEPLTNGNLRKGLAPVYAATRAAEDYKARVNDNLTREVKEVAAIEISE